MSHFGVQTRDDGRSVSFEDPWANEIRAAVADTTVPDAATNRLEHPERA